MLSKTLWLHMLQFAVLVLTSKFTRKRCSAKMFEHRRLCIQVACSGDVQCKTVECTVKCKSMMLVAIYINQELLK